MGRNRWIRPDGTYPPMAGGSDQGVTEATTTDAGGGGEGGGEAAPDPISKLTSAFETFQTDIGSRLERIEQSRQDPEDEGEPADEEDLPELEFEFGDEDFDEQGQLTNDAQMREFANMMRAIAREEQAPIIAEREDQRRVAEADALEERYPALRDEATQDRYVEMTVQAARALGQPELAREPRFFEMVYLQDLGKQGAEAEVPAGSTRGATLERGGGASPAEGGDANDAIADRIVNVSKTGRFRLGSR
jgi:hypothetical protein